jgi:Transposase IS116/IS110/IS902 family
VCGGLGRDAAERLAFGAAELVGDLAESVDEGGQGVRAGGLVQVVLGRGGDLGLGAVAETGVDMTRFRTGPHLVSWGGRAPQDHKSGKRAGRAKAKKGNRYLGAVLGETAVAAGRT